MHQAIIIASALAFSTAAFAQTSQSTSPTSPTSPTNSAAQGIIRPPPVARISAE
jgi:hypothetical protein